MYKGMPSNISYTILVHAGSYNDFIAKLNKSFPSLKIRHLKRVAIHYYIFQVEDTTEKGISKKAIYDLPLMALREEFSSYIFFKSTKSYNNVLKRMCHANEDKEAAHKLTCYMLTPLEKGKILKLDDAESLEIKVVENNEEVTKTYFKEAINQPKVLANLFCISEAKVDEKQVNLLNEIKDEKWVIGICK